MNTLICAIYGEAQPSSALASALGIMLSKIGSQVFALRCSGVLNTCDLDLLSLNKQRCFGQCLKCTALSRDLLEWGGLNTVSLRDYITSQELLELRTWFESLSAVELSKASLNGVELAQLVLEAFKEQKSFKAERQDILRSYGLTAAIILTASDKLFKTDGLERVFIAEPGSVVGSALNISAKRSSLEVVTFEQISQEQVTDQDRTIVIRSNRFSMPYGAGLDLPSLKTMRSDPRLWPPTVYSELDQITRFLNQS